MSQEILAAAIGAVVGAVATYQFDVSKRRAQRDEEAEDRAKEKQARRAAVATALLADLRVIEHVMLKLYKNQIAATWRGRSPAQVYDALRGELVIMSPTTVSAVLDVFGFVADVFVILGDPDKPPAADIPPRIHWLVRTKAAFALRSIDRAVSHLVTEGGELPQHPPAELFHGPQLPSIPKPRFIREGEEPEPDED